MTATKMTKNMKKLDEKWKIRYKNLQAGHQAITNVMVQEHSKDIAQQIFWARVFISVSLLLGIAVGVVIGGVI